MGCDPPEGGGDERYYLYFDSSRLAIFGHTIDVWGLSHFPEDFPGIEHARQLGREFGCWHSVACYDGEFGTNPADRLIELTYHQWIQAKEVEWDIDHWKGSVRR